MDRYRTANYSFTVYIGLVKAVINLPWAEFSVNCEFELIIKVLDGRLAGLILGMSYYANTRASSSLRDEVTVHTRCN